MIIDMKRNWIIISLLILLGFCFSSCKDKKGKSTSGMDSLPVIATRSEVNGSALITCDYSKLGDFFDVPLSLFVDDLEFIKLENIDEAMVSSRPTIITDNYILVRNDHHNPFKLFDRKGKFLNTIGSYGEGPDEYLNVYDQALDEETGQIFILPWQSNKILRFDLQGNPLKHIPLPYRVPKGRFYVDAKKEQISVVLLPFEGLPVISWSQDFEGNMIHSIPMGHMAIEPDFSNEIGSEKNVEGFDFSVFTFYDQRPDTLYHYNIDSNKLEPKFTLNFNGKPWKIHSYRELPNHFIGDVTVEKKVTKFLSETEEPALYIVDKKTLKGGFVNIYNDFLGNTPLPILYDGFSHGYFVWNVNPAEIIEILKQRLKDEDELNDSEKERLRQMLSEMDENDNNYIFLGKLKN